MSIILEIYYKKQLKKYSHPWIMREDNLQLPYIIYIICHMRKSVREENEIKTKYKLFIFEVIFKQ